MEFFLWNIGYSLKGRRFQSNCERINFLNNSLEALCNPKEGYTRSIEFPLRPNEELLLRTREGNLEALLFGFCSSPQISVFVLEDCDEVRQKIAGKHPKDWPRELIIFSHSNLYPLARLRGDYQLE